MFHSRVHVVVLGLLEELLFLRVCTQRWRLLHRRHCGRGRCGHGGREHSTETCRGRRWRRLRRRHIFRRILRAGASQASLQRSFPELCRSWSQDKMFLLGMGIHLHLLPCYHIYALILDACLLLSTGLQESSRLICRVFRLVSIG